MVRFLWVKAHREPQYCQYIDASVRVITFVLTKYRNQACVCNSITSRRNYNRELLSALTWMKMKISIKMSLKGYDIKTIICNAAEFSEQETYS